MAGQIRRPKTPLHARSGPESAKAASSSSKGKADKAAAAPNATTGKNTIESAVAQASKGNLSGPPNEKNGAAAKTGGTPNGKAVKAAPAPRAQRGPRAIKKPNGTPKTVAANAVTRLSCSDFQER